ncbi:Hob2p [Lachancea thermotolerans CBS 6340]|uniref:KLTH0E05434p n=1 Tax=Lachancea thermotolerans (strain ATCC 56472 / CBS 6340 / NRRL Y-8284) TaxID=559295 RepID=C5DHL9_LACTC|nr:KLTH0E05434p [Lachancea thermotolerans CBS 6340]CAR23280.1 KLTH0E05434p [Lachancea thermotolerans CBS 6340]
MHQFLTWLPLASRYAIYAALLLLLIPNVIIHFCICHISQNSALPSRLTLVPWINGVRFLYVTSERYTLWVRRIKLKFKRALEIELEGLSITLKGSQHLTKSNPHAADLKKPLPQIFIKPLWLTLLKFVRPRKLILKDLVLHVPASKRTFKIETLLIECKPLPGKSPSVSVSLVAICLSDSLGQFSAHTIDYASSYSFTRQNTSRGFCFELKNHVQALTIRGLQARLDKSSQTNYEKRAQHTEEPHSSLDLKRFSEVLIALSDLEIRLENLALLLEDSLQFRSSGILFTTKAIDPSHHSMLDLFPAERKLPLNHEITLSINSLTGLVNGQEVLRIPSINCTSASDLTSFLLLRKPPQLKIGLTLTIVDTAITATKEQLGKLWVIYTTAKSSSPKSGTSRWRYWFSQIKCPHFIVKIIMSNFSFTLRLSQSKHFVVRVSNLHAFGHNSMKPNTIVAYERLNVKGMKNTRDYVDNFLKIDRFSLSYFRADEATNIKVHDIPVVVFSKWEFFSKKIITEESNLTSTLRDLKISLEHSEVLAGASNFLDEWTYTLSAFNQKKDPTDAKGLKYSLRLRLKNTSLSVLVANHLKKELDVLGDDKFNLADYTRGASVCLEEAFLDAMPDECKLHIVHAFVYRVMGHPDVYARSDEIANLKDFVISSNSLTNHCFAPALNIKVDVNAIWLYYYLKDIATNYLRPKKLRASSDKVPFNDLCKEWHVEVASLLIEIGLPHSTKLLFDFENAHFSGESLALHLDRLVMFSPSVYREEEIFVPLALINDFTLDIERLVAKRIVSLNAGFMSLKFEYHLRLYKILDNVMTLVKCFKQIRACFESPIGFKRLKPVPEEPKRVFPIDLSLDLLSLNVEEDPFEQELGLVFKVGVSEQQERLEKLRLFYEEIDSFEPNKVLSQEEMKLKYDSRMQKLFENFSTSWINRIRKARLTFFGNPSQTIKLRNAGTFRFRSLDGMNSTVLKVELERLKMKLREPSFSLDKCSEFLYKYGKQIPKDTAFTTLLPLGISLETERWEIRLRDYPLPILFFPSVEISGDITFAERMPQPFSERFVHVPFVPMASLAKYSNIDSVYGASVIRTLNPVKTYMNLRCQIDSTRPTTITWGKALQPGYQSVMIWFDYLTKPPIDPSEKLGFWDKFRLLIHGKFVFEWAGDSHIHLNIKGSHDPYLITDDGAGLSFCWGGSARLAIHESSDPTEFLKITSKHFLLAIRDFTSPQKIEKALMELNGTITWTMGLAFESGNPKNPGMEERSSNFKPHYHINLFNPAFLEGDKTHDSYAGFRSDFIHLFFRVHASSNPEGSNKVFLAPHCMAHFLKWWSLFSTYTSGPIRQGSLFPDLVQNPKKFSKALFTVKYELHLTPLVISHTYRHADSRLNIESDNETAFTSLKGKFETLKLELHQKRVKMMHSDKKLNVSRTVWKFKMNAGEIDCVSADIRFVYTMLGHPSGPRKGGATANIENDVLKSSWFDFEDYNDLNQITFADPIPLNFCEAPLLYSPRISYLRELNEGVPLDYPFGDESVHECTLGHNHPEVTQRELAKKRAREIETQLDQIEQSIEALSSVAMKGSNGSVQKLELLGRQLHEFRHRLHIIHKVLEDLKLSKMPSSSLLSDDIESELSERHSDKTQDELENALAATATIASFRSMRKVTSAFVKSSFDNRFIIHNMLLKVNNKTRDLLLNYAFNVFSRKKSSFFQTYKAVALLDELLKNRLWNTSSRAKDSAGFFTLEDNLSNADLLERCDEIIREVFEDGFKTFDNYQIKFVSPQIQVTSEAVPRKCILVTARDIETSIVDVNQLLETNQNVPLDVNSLVETRYCAKLNEAHFLIFDKCEIAIDDGLGFQTNGYGMDTNSSFWPPWLPMEMCYNCESLTDSVFLSRSEMILLFTQPNSLFFQDKTKNFGRSEAKFRIGFPELFLTSTSDQYSSIYAIAVELLHFASSFDNKADKLSRVLLAEEVRNNLDRLDTSIIVNLQKTVKNLYRTRGYLKVHDPKGYEKVAQSIAAEIEATVLELNLLMSAIKKNHDRLKVSNVKGSSQDRLNWQIGADEVTWQLYDEFKNSFVSFELGPACFIRSQAPDGANNNKVSISSLECFNLQKNAVYKQLLGPHDNDTDTEKPMIQILWAMGPAIGGIADLEQLVVLLEPFKFKMDHLTSDILLKYLFPGTNEASTAAQSDIAFDVASIGLSKKNTESSETWKLKSVPSLLPPNPLKKSDTEARNSVSLSRRGTGRDMNEMVTRSSRYFNVRSVVIRKVTMSISYKGSRSLITNVDGLTVKVPTLRYTNKLWSRDEFIATLKKDIIKVVLQHTGYIIGNKFTLHKKENEAKFSKALIKTSVGEADSLRSASSSQHKTPQLRHISSSLKPESSSDGRSGHLSQDQRSGADDVTAFYPASHQ